MMVTRGLTKVAWGTIGVVLGLGIPARGQTHDTPHKREIQLISPYAASATPTVAELATKAGQFARLRNMLADNKLLPVIVQLDVPDIQALTRASLAAKNPQAIRGADGRLKKAVQDQSQAELTKLVGTRYRLGNVFQTIPFMALAVSREALDALERSPNVVGIVEDRLVRPMLNNTTGIVGAVDAWARGYDGSGWYVAILDTGLNAPHEFFAGKNIVQACFAHGADFSGDCPNGAVRDTLSPDAARLYPSNFDGFDHGTHVAGIALGNGPGFPAAGVARGADIIAVKVFSKFAQTTACDPDGAVPMDCLLAFNADIIAGLEFVFTLRDVLPIASINMSLGGGAFTNQMACDNADPATKMAIDDLRAVSIATVIAAGNDSFCDKISSPGCISSAVAVGAVSNMGNEADFSNFQTTMLDLYAPGVSVLSSIGPGTDVYGNKSGTSMATPHVAGSFAIMRQALPFEGVGFILDALQSTGTPVTGKCVTTPSQKRIQIDAALDQFAPTIRSCVLTELVATSVTTGAEYGTVMAIQQDEAIIGARSEDCAAGSRCGAAYLYHWDGTAWVAEDKVTAGDAAPIDRFGGAVALQGDLAVVGASFDDLGTDADAGSIYTFRHIGSNWSSEQKLTAGDAAAGDRFGDAVAAGTNVILVGAENAGNTGMGDGTGAAYVFTFDGSSWTQSQKLLASDAAPFAEFGASVSLSGDVAVIGSPSASCSAGSDCGAVYIFAFDGANWVERQRLEPPDLALGDGFGSSVSLDQDVLVVGAPFVACNQGILCGAVYVYEQAGGMWTQSARIQPRDADTLDFFGKSVSLSQHTALVGAYANDCVAGSDCGTAYLVRRGSGGWFVDVKLADSSLAAVDQFGWSVALDGPLAMVGARLRDSLSLINAGAAFAFAVAPVPDCNFNGLADACDILSGFSQDLDANGQPDECICVVASAPTTDTLGTRNRFLTVSAGDPGSLQAVRVKLVDLPPPFDAHNGESLWVQEPRTVSENSGVVDPAQAPAWPTFQAAFLGCDPVLRDWTTFGKINVFHPLIVPDGIYDVQVITQGCDTLTPGNFSTPLTLTTTRWGDVISDCTSLPCGPPDGKVDVTTDVTSVLDKFKNIETGPEKSRSDLEPDVLDFKINITDVNMALDAFRSLSYPFGDPGGLTCP